MVRANSRKVSLRLRYSGYLSKSVRGRLQAFHLLSGDFPTASSSALTLYRGPMTPPKIRWFGLFRFRSPLLTESLRFLFLWLLRCFTSPGIASCVSRIRLAPGVTPFGHPWIKARLQLPMAFRSLLRPSSPFDTKAYIISP